MLRDSRVYVDPDNFNPDRFLATEGRVPEMDPSEVGVFGFGRRYVHIRSGERMKLTEISLLQQVPRAISRRIVNLAWCSIHPCCL